jgi:hypothetical protein
VLIAADDALKSATEAGNRTSIEVDKKFEEAVNLLRAFEKDFPVRSEGPRPDRGTVTREENTSNKSLFPSTILYGLKKKFHAAKVTFPYIPLPLNSDKYQPKLTRVVKFYLLSSLPNAYPIVVKRGCHANDIAPGI